MPLKPYLEAVKEHCEKLSRDELIETLLELAQEAPVRERADFLDRIRAFGPRSVTRKRQTGKDFAEKLLEQIAGLVEEIEERIESIENGDYWDDPDRLEEGGYDDEEPDFVTSEQAEELENLFLETGGIFLDGRMETACRLYGALFALMDKSGEVSGYLSRESLDIREERARYCRCVYETVDPKRRAQALLDSIGIDAPVNYYRLDVTSERHPMLQDVIDARPGELADWESFLPAWEKRLASCHGNRAAILRMEAVQKLKGIDGLSKLARKWKSDRPHGYLFWIQCLEKDGDWRGMLDVCREALEALPKSSFREQTAEYLTKAASELCEPEFVLLGKRERFLSAPGERNLLELLREAETQNVRLRELGAVIASSEGNKGDEVEQKDLHVKMLLMAGRLNKAFEEGQSEKSLGWSYGKAGVLFASILSVLTGNSPKAGTIRAVLKEYAESRDYYYGDDGEEGRTEGVYKEILTGLESVGITEPEARKYGAWADKIGRVRVEAIVSGQHRGAYDRAARVLGALAEYYILAKEKDKARSLLHEFVFVKFPRHNAFRREVKSVAAGSALIKDLGVI